MKRLERIRVSAVGSRRPSIVLSLLVLMLVVGGVVTPRTTSHIEDFTTDTYKDTLATTALWNTGTGTLGLSEFELMFLGQYHREYYDGANNVAVVGDYVLVSSMEQGVLSIDVSDPNNPTIVSDDSYDVPPPTDLAIAGDHLYAVIHDYEFRAYSITDPTQPVEVGSCEPSRPSARLALSGNYAFLSSIKLSVIDISDPTNPAGVGSYHVSPTTYPGGVVVAGDLVYATYGAFGLDIFDVSDPLAPSLVGSYSVGGANDVALAGDLAYVTVGSGGLRVIDVSDTTSLSLVGTYDTDGYARYVTIEGDYAYLGTTSDSGQCCGALEVLDISDPTNPTLLHSYDTGEYTAGTSVSGQYAAVADRQEGVFFLQAADPVPPTQVGSFNAGGNVRMTTIEGDYAFIAASAAGLVVADVTDPTSPVSAGSYITGADAMGVDVAGNYAYVADIGSGLVVVDISDPTSPSLAGSHDTGGWAMDVAVDGDYAFVADTDSLIVVDVSDPTTPSRAGSRSVLGLAYDVVVAGDYAFVAAASAGLAVIDISDPTVPGWAGWYNSSGTGFGVALHGDYAFLADYSGGLKVVDITDPTNPTHVASQSTGGNAYGVAIAGDQAYVANDEDGLAVFDITDPTSPTLIATQDTDGEAWGVTIEGDYAFVSDWDGGLKVFEVFQRQFNLDDNVGKSTVFEHTAWPVHAVRVTTVQEDSVTWEVSADYDSNWAEIPLDGLWHLVSVPGNGLSWRSTHTYAGGNVNPACSYLTVEWRDCTVKETLWVPPYPTIQAAVDVACDGDTIAVHNGTWTGPGNRDIDFGGKNLVLRSATGNPELCVIDCGGSPSEPHRGFYFHSGEDTSSVIEGIGVRGGYYFDGAAVRADNAAPRFVDCRFVDNLGPDQTVGIGFADYVEFVGCEFASNAGVGLEIWDTEANVYDCTFETSGSHGVYLYQGVTAMSLCHFDDNGGDGLSAQGPEVLDVALCTFDDNTSAGLHLNDPHPVAGCTDVDIEMCTFERNDAGGLILEGSGCVPSVSYCAFRDNTASNGGGVYLSGAGGTFNGCTFENNAASSNGGGLCATMPENIAVTTSVFNGNSATNGGGVYALLSDELDVFSCTFYGNTASSAGGGINLANPQTPMNMQFTIIAFGGGGGAVNCASSSDVNMMCNDIYGNGGGDYVGGIAGLEGTTGNFSLDPYFCDAPNGDLHLSQDSPCLTGGCGQVGAFGQGCNATEPVIVGVTDVPGDQGGEVAIEWERSRFDAPGDTVTLGEYRIYRRGVVRALGPGPSFWGDLSSWTAVDYDVYSSMDGAWTLGPDDTTAIQGAQCDVSLLLDDREMSNYVVEGTLEVAPAGDDDYLGLAFGYEDSSHFYIFAWKRADQGTASEGFMIKKLAALSASEFEHTDFWMSGSSIRSTMLASNLGAGTGWTHGVRYTYRLEFASGDFHLVVREGSTVLWEVTVNDGDYPLGRFGFYNYTQPDVSYSARITSEEWECVATVAAAEDSVYQHVVETLCDSTIVEGMQWSKYYVSAVMPDTTEYYDSAPDSGYSLDNLVPAAPTNLSAAYNTGSGNHLTWDASSEPDFDHYRVYRNDAWVADVVHPEWYDPDHDGWGHDYEVSTVDDSGHESERSEPGLVSGVEVPEVPTTFALHPCYPNPFNPTTVIRYDVPAGGGEVTIAIFDVAGRHVKTLVDGPEGVGVKTVTWSGENAQGQPVATGVYFCRMKAPGYTRTTKMTILK